MEEYFEDFLFASFIKETGIRRKNINEILDSGLVSSYRHILTGDVLGKINELSISDKTKEYLKLAEKNYKEISGMASEMRKSSENNGIGIVSCEDTCYPKVWKEINGMPFIVFYKGNKELLDNVNNHGSVCIVGSREPSAYASYAAKEFSEYFSSRGITVVSGLASGIDREAHLGSVNEKGRTIAFVAGGPENIYPPSNKDIYSEIVKKGLVLSEMPPGTKPVRQYFPSRNRLISGISDCCLIMEAGNFSGTLHTASFAAAQGKEVYSLPGNIYQGNNMGGLKLIKDGAKILIDPEDVINDVSECVFYRIGDYSLFSGQKKKKSIKEIRIRLKEDYATVSDEDIKAVIKDELSVHSESLDMLTVSLSVPFGKLAGLTSEMEVDGEIESKAGKFFLTF